MEVLDWHAFPAMGSLVRLQPALGKSAVYPRQPSVLNTIISIKVLVHPLTMNVSDVHLVHPTTWE